MDRIKALAIALLAMLTVCTAQAQSIIPQNATTDDYIQLFNRAVTAQQAEVEVQGDNIQRLNHAGFEAFAFDISSMEMDKYDVRPVIMKYEDGEMEKFLQKMENWGSKLSIKSPRFIVGISPRNDSSLQCHLFWGGVGIKPLIRFKMVHGCYHIVSTPFVLPKELKLNEFIPLMAVSSGWYDEDNECVRNCDVDEFDSNYLETATFKNSPLIYVIGVTCWKL